MRYPRLISAAVLVLASLAAGCDDTPAESAPITGSFVSRVDSSEAFIAIVNDGGEVRAYVCDRRPDSAATVSVNPCW